MKKCDLHIHTVQSVSDHPFKYDLNVLVDYVSKSSLDVIAITNHNLFDMTQFQEIKDALPGIVVLPGVEVDLEGGHILVIANNDDPTLYEFNSKCGQIKSLIKSQSDYIDYEVFSKIFDNKDKYLFIPHYDKEPQLNKPTIEKFGTHIIAGEVSSIKKFIYLKKEASELTPVYFSDFRVEAGIKEENYPVKHTFIDIDEVNINALKHCLMDKTKVSSSAKDGIELFQIFSNGQMLSTGLNIMYGKRSTGKTFTLDAIANSFGEKAKYIRQFELLNVGKNDSDQFSSDMKIRQQRYAEEYLKEFEEVVSDMLKINTVEEDNLKVEKYLLQVMESAEQNGIIDVFSKSKLFNESLFKETNQDGLQHVIKAVQTLLESELYKDIIDKYIPAISLKKLLKELIGHYWNDRISNLFSQEVNNIISLVKDKLQSKSAAPRISEIDLYEYLLNEVKRERFKEIVNGLKLDKTIHAENSGRFKITVSSRPFKNANDLKSVKLPQMSLSAAFSRYNDPLKYLEELKIAGVDVNRIYQLFVAIDYKILNDTGLGVSGGERSEFNFLQKIKDAILCDILIIDEPESSFDNLFLKHEVNLFIKEMSRQMPVIISTHNNTIGGSIKPDYILYTEKEVVNGVPHFNIYSGFPTAKMLKDVKGNSIENYVITLNSLEAGETAYSERKIIYETLKN